MSHDTPVQQLRVADRRLVPRLPRGPGRRQGPPGPAPRHAPPHHGELQPAPAALLRGRAARWAPAPRPTSEITVPKTIGVPMSPGMKLGMYVAWHNDTGKDLDGVYPQADHAVDAQEPESATGQLDADLHGREPDRRREQHVRRAAGQVVEVVRVHPAGRRPAARRRRATCTTTASACGSRTRRPARSSPAWWPTRDAKGKVIKSEPEALRRERRRAQAQGQSQVSGRRRSTTIRPTRPGSRARWRTWSACSCPTT